ncbi:MAG TPA: RNA-binding domain-containing protein [Paludibacter sp.]
MALHINIEDLLSSKTVESDRIEFKEGWNPDSIYRSICAFANDFDNTGGGYILIGVAEDQTTKTAVRPVKGLTTKVIGDINTEMIGLNNLIKPYYAPKLFVEEVDDQQIIVLWVIAGSERPYEVPETITAKHKTWKYYIRKYANSIEAKGAEKEELIALSNNIPFDDRANTQAVITDISMALVQDHLRKIGSKLFNEVGKLTDIEVLQQMALLSGPMEHLFPRNVALMLFSEKPDKYFPYTLVEIVHFPKGASDKEFTEKRIDGPIQQQITDSLAWLRNNILQEKVLKIPGQAEALRTWNYPYTALEEAIANCLFHRNYQVREPVEIRIEPNFILLYNSGGPDRSIKREDFAIGKVIPKRYRNRRLGDFLKELRLTEAHATGLPALRKAMQLNGSPEPVFDFDDERTWFQVMLPIHPSFNRTEMTFPTSGYETIHELLKNILQQYSKDLGTTQSAIASVIAGDIAEHANLIDIQAIEILRDIDGDIADDIAGAIVGAIAGMNMDSELKILKLAKQPSNREEFLTSLSMTNHRKNYERYMLPMIENGWLTMTIPDKPTSPKQQYLTTLKGRLILEFLKHKTK